MTLNMALSLLVDNNLIKEVEKSGVPLLLIFCYGSPPNDFMAYLDMIHEDANFEYLIFPLNMVMAQQIVAYVYAKRQGYSVNEEAWKVKATEILEELHFDRRIAEWIEEGKKKGYTVQPPPKDFLGIRYFLNYPAKEATAEEIFNYTEGLKREFTIFARGFNFGAVPLDVESFEKFRDDLG